MEEVIVENKFLAGCKKVLNTIASPFVSLRNKYKETKFYKGPGKSIEKGLKNPTFVYILKRILSSLFTLVLLVALVTLLIRLLPDTKFYDVKLYNTLKGKNKIMGERYLASELFKYGIMDLEGNRRSVLYSIGQQIYYILPIYKVIPVRWSADYSEVLVNWTGFIYLGRGLQSGEYIIDMVKSRMGISMTVSLVTVFFTYLIGVPFGIAMAKKPGGTVDKIGNIFIVLNWAIPAIVFYLIMNRIMGDKEGIFGWGNFDYFYDSESPVLSLIPPIFCVVFLGIPGITIWVRRYMIDELNSDYVKFARSKGISENRIMYTHVLRNACVPLVRGIPGTFLGAIVGSYYIETIWSIPGTGILLTTGIQKFDIPVIMGLTVLYSAISMLSFLLGDLIVVLFDPRIRVTNR